MENLLLEADELGLGAVWMGISPDEGRMKAGRQENVSLTPRFRVFWKNKRKTRSPGLTIHQRCSS